MGNLFRDVHLPFNEEELGEMYGSICINLMKACWKQDPDKRPNFQQIVDETKKLKYNLSNVSPRQRWKKKV